VVGLLRDRLGPAPAASSRLASPLLSMAAPQTPRCQHPGTDTEHAQQPQLVAQLAMMGKQRRAADWEAA